MTDSEIELTRLRAENTQLHAALDRLRQIEPDVIDTWGAVQFSSAATNEIGTILASAPDTSVAAIKAHALEEFAELWAESDGIETLTFAADDVAAVQLTERALLARAAEYRSGAGIPRPPHSHEIAEHLEKLAAVLSNTNPSGFGHGTMNEGSRSTWYSRGKRDSVTVTLRYANELRKSGDQ